MSIFVQNSQFAGAGKARGDDAAARVIVATIERPHGDTGIHAHTAALMEGLTRAGIECELANPFSAGPKWLPLFAVRRLILRPVSKTWSLRWYRHWHYAALRESLTRTLLRRSATVVIAQCPVSARAALEVRRRLKLGFRIALVCHFNYSEATEYRERGELNDPKTFERVMKLEALVLKSVDQVIYVSGWSRDVVERERGIVPKQSQVIPNGIAAESDAQPLHREDLGLKKDDLVLVNAGTLEPRKNQVGLIGLFARLRPNYPQAKLLLVGDGPARHEIEAKIGQYNLADGVLLMGHRNDVPELLKIADVYVHYATLENCPMILLEAARASLPAAAIPVGGIAEIGQKLGALVYLHESDLAASVTALMPLLDDATLRREHGEQARRGFEAHFTREAMVTQYLTALGFVEVMS